MLSVKFLHKKAHMLCIKFSPKTDSHVKRKFFTQKGPHVMR